MWLRHGVDEWHLDCEVEGEAHSPMASVRRSGNTLTLTIPGEEGKSFTRTFPTTETLNRFLVELGLETLKTNPLTG